MKKQIGNLTIIQTGEDIMAVLGHKGYIGEDNLSINIEKLISDDCWNNPCIIVPFANVLMDSRECMTKKNKIFVIKIRESLKNGSDVWLITSDTRRLDITLRKIAGAICGKPYIEDRFIGRVGL